MRRGENSFRYDLEAVGVKQGSKSSMSRKKVRMALSPKQSKVQADEQISKLDSKIFAN